MTVKASFWTQVIADLNLTDTPDLRGMFTAWERAEGGNAHHNPLNTTLKLKGSTDYNPNNGVPVQSYVSQEQGVFATVTTLKDVRHDRILTSLRAANSPYFTAIEISYDGTWGTNGFLLCEVLHDLGIGKA